MQNELLLCTPFLTFYRLINPNNTHKLEKGVVSGMFVDVFVPSETKGSTTGDSVKFNCLAINIYNT